MRVPRDLAAIQWRADREIDRLQRPMMRSVGDAVRRYAVETPDGPRLDWIGRAMVMHTVDAELDRIYGRFRGDTSGPLYALIVLAARAAALLPLTAAVAMIRRRTGVSSWR